MEHTGTCQREFETGDYILRLLANILTTNMTLFRLSSAWDQ
jgi:hypothetical protein